MSLADLKAVKTASDRVCSPKDHVKEAEKPQRFQNLISSQLREAIEFCAPEAWRQLSEVGDKFWRLRVQLSMSMPRNEEVELEARESACEYKTHGQDVRI